MSDPVRLFDRAALARHQRRARALNRPDADFLLLHALDDLQLRLAAVNRPFPVALDLFTPRAAAFRVLAADGRSVIGAAAPWDARGALERPALVADPDALPFGAGSLDFACSLLALQWCDDLPGLLAQVRRALRPDGLFLACLVGGRSLHELRSAWAQAQVEVEGGASPRVIPFLDVRDAGALLQRAGFALPVADVEPLVVRYDSMFALAADLRAMGATNPLVERARRPLRRATLLRAAELYATRFADPDGRVRATFELVWLSGWVPHESQRKPLQPGSATHSLAAALGVHEGGPSRSRQDS